MGLKRLNDEEGHEGGDMGLREFSARVRGAIRRSDLFARIGGDEFVILMKVPDKAAASSVCDRLNTTLNLDAAADPGKLQCSLGALFLPQGSQSIDQELNLADQLMYAAKKTRAGCIFASVMEAPGGELSLYPPLEIDPASDRRTVVRMRKQPLERITAADTAREHTAAI